MEARHVIARRSDLSTFLVHLTRASGGQSGSDRLKSILRDWMLRASSMFGAAKSALEAKGAVLESQKCVCFSETPLEYVHLLLEEIDNRQIRLEPYGIAFPKKLGRTKGVNPVWYVDISPGHDWLMVPINQLVQTAMASGNFEATSSSLSTVHRADGDAP